MKRELDEKLCAKYPKIFVNRDKDMMESARYWGFEHGDGWYWLIDQLCGCIQGLIDNNPHLNIQQVVATQVKEKFGGLRFYIDGGNDDIQGMVSLAEHMSYAICEMCGSTENVGTTAGWITTVCKACLDKDERFKDRVWTPNEETI